MYKGPIIEEVRAIREARAASFNYDIDAIFEDLMSRRQNPNRTYLSFAPKPYPPNGLWPIKALHEL